MALGDRFRDEAERTAGLVTRLWCSVLLSFLKVGFHGDRESCHVQVVRVDTHKSVVLSCGPRSFELGAVQEMVMVLLHVEAASAVVRHVV